MNPTNENPSRLPQALPELAPAEYCDPVIEYYKKDVDRTLLRENLKLTVEQRLLKAMSFHQSLDLVRDAAQRAGWIQAKERSR